MKKGRCILFLFGPVLFLSSCMSKKMTALEQELGLKYRQNTCFHNAEIIQQKDAGDFYPKVLTDTVNDTLLSQHFSDSEVHFLTILGIYEEVRDLLSQKYPSQSLEQQALKAKIQYRLHLQSIEVSGITAMLDCEEERVEQIADYLAELESKREKKLTVGSIITGGAVGVGSVLLLTGDREGRWIDFLGIIGGVAEVVLGVQILRTNFEIQMEHPVNPLREVFFRKRSTTFFSDEVWWFLNDYRLEEGGPVVAENLREEWTRFYDLNEESSFFDSAGKYNASTLKLRADLIDQLEARVLLMKQNIAQILRKLEFSY